MRNSLRCLGALLILSLAPLSDSRSQVMASLTEPSQDTHKKQENSKPLVSILNSLENRFKVNFSYSASLLKGKVVDIRSFDLSSGDLEDLLKSLLMPFRLKYEKLEEKDYVIYDDRERNLKEINKKSNSSSFHPSEIMQLDKLDGKNASLNRFEKAEITIKGRVTDENGNPLPGVSVFVKGTTIGSITDAAGKYILNIPDENAVIVFSFIGYVSEEKMAKATTEWDVSLIPDLQSLNEVVVVGYGSEKKRDVIGSVSTVHAKDLNLKSMANFDAGLQGLAAGMSVQSQSGSPGAPSRILIRGANSINTGTDPLWIIDGIPVYSSPTGLGQSNQNPMSLINPNDIESIQVLKDAAATSIYGSRAAGGVILVTTKKGKLGEGSTTFNYSTGFSRLTRTPEDLGYVNTQQWFSTMKEAYQNSGSTFTMDQYYDRSPKATTRLTQAQAENLNTDWYDKIFRTGVFSDYNLSSSRGFDRGSFFVSGNYRKDKGVQENNDLERISIRSNLTFNPSKSLTVGLNLNFAYTNNERRFSGTTAIITYALPWFPVRDISNPAKYYNPFAQGNLAARNDPNDVKNTVEQYRGLGGLSLNYDVPFIKGLSLRTELSADILRSTLNDWESRELYLNIGRSTDESVNFNGINYNGYITYTKSEGDHSFTAVAGSEATRSSQFKRYLSGEGLVGKFQEFGSPTSITQVYGRKSDERYLLGYFGRINYKFKERYLLGFSARRDGSSAFIEKNRWDNFFAASAGWIISDENFMSFLGESTFLKLRGSYGEIGNQGIPGGLNEINYYQNAKYGSGVGGTVPTNVPVSNLQWEKTRSSDIGLDFGFLKNRVNGSLAFYRRSVYNLLLKTPSPYSTGVSSDEPNFDDGSYVEELPNAIWGNVGNLVNSGVEFELHSVNLDRNGLKWTTDFNISFNKNLIKSLSPDIDKGGQGIVGAATVSRKGKLRNEWFIADYAGVDTQTGVPMIYVRDEQKYIATGETERLKKENGTDSLTYATIANIRTNRFYQDGKSGDPKYYGGIRNTIQYKAFDLSFMFTFSGGNYILDYDRQMSLVPNPTRTFLKELQEKSWKKPGDVAKYPQLTADNAYVINGKLEAGFGDANAFHNRELYKGDFIRLRNVQLGYSLPFTVLQKARLQGARVYISGSNLLTFTEYPGFDPESAGNPSGQRDNVSGFVFETTTIPQLRSIIIGAEVKF